MTLYEIDRSIDDLISRSIDPETGELLIDPEELEALQMEREAKLENIALYVKNLTAESAAIKAEENTLAERRKALEAKSERLKAYLESALDGKKFSTARVAVSFRNTQAVELDEEKFWSWAVYHSEYTRRKDPEPNKTEISRALKNGINIPGAALVAGRSMTIK